VPYYVVAGTGFFGQQEVLDLLNALRVIDNPDDDIALVGVLRSSLVGPGRQRADARRAALRAALLSRLESVAAAGAGRPARPRR